MALIDLLRARSKEKDSGSTDYSIHSAQVGDLVAIPTDFSSSTSGKVVGIYYAQDEETSYLDIEQEDDGGLLRVFAAHVTSLKLVS